MAIETGALEQAYAKIETTYAASAAAGGEALAATDAIRHLELSLTSKKNRRDSPEKRGTPDVYQRLPDRQSQEFNLSSIMWEPSGTLGTISNVGKFLKAGMGGGHTLTLATTVASGAATTGCVLTSGTGVAVNDVCIVTVDSGARREATRIKSVATVTTVTWDPISVAPDLPGAVVFGVTHQLASSLTETLAVYKFYNAGNFKQATFGNVVDQIEISFDGTKEVGLSISGPGGRYADSSTGGGTVQAKPAAHTTVGGPVGGMVGNFYVDGTAFLVIGVKATISNAIELRNKELGTAWATGIAGRTDRRMVKVSITFYLEDTNLLGKANSITSGVLRCVVGDVNGSMLAMVCPNVEFEIPEVGSDDGPKELTIEGYAKAVSGNDSIFLAEC